MNKFRRSLLSILAKNTLGDMPFFHYEFNNNSGTYTSVGSNNYTLNYKRASQIVYNDNDKSITTNVLSTFPDSGEMPYTGAFNTLFDIIQGKCQTFQFTFGDSGIVNESNNFYLYYFTNISGTTKCTKAANVSNVNINGYEMSFNDLYNLCNGFKNGKLTISFISNGLGLRVWWNKTKIIDSATHQNGAVGGKCKWYVSYNLHLKEIKTWFNFDNLWDDEILKRNI